MPSSAGGLGLHVVARGHHLGDQLALDAIDDLGVQAVFLRAGGRQPLLHQLEGQRFQVGDRAAACPWAACRQHARAATDRRSARRRWPSPRPARCSFAARGRCPANGSSAGPRAPPWLDVHHVAVVLFVVDVEEMADQLGHVLAALAQRRQVDRHHVEPVVQVLAESLGLDLLRAGRDCWRRSRAYRRESSAYRRRARTRALAAPAAA